MKGNPEVSALARPFLRALQADMDAKGSNIVAEWTGSGYLLIVATGWKANTLDAYLRGHRMAEPRNRKDTDS